ncbi:PACE efflux transporter [Ancylobacter oerskovii]|uniref:PACE efflux transporter n=1 Tax=Ancylobacter oerskovii TaxID=459519 RepID=A0ABW4YU95_9HYPH|nr:PACE efflux transporter [Ancylobacter oerskovii]MBS7543562.1 PACE efflux transporter [Ancylobacter oerskovii]
MRTTRDRIRHAVLFEIVALAIVAPIGALVFDVPVDDFGVVAIVSTTIAMVWNYVYNLAFDHAMLKLWKHTRKTLGTRLIHAALFEAGLLCALVSFIAWYLGVGLWQALVMDVALAGFYVVYAFLFNWGYDHVFPLKPGLSSI